MKLHLGCGQGYLEGYVNIDLPLSEHSIQERSVADVHADITTMSYPASSIDEVRLHHVFEHFTRPVACALVTAWRHWLKSGGRLHIEVPDFGRTARSVLDPTASRCSKAVALRHIFGSHEAPWAVHRDGWTTDRLKGLLELSGFEILEVKNNSWKGTYNFEMIAVKSDEGLSREEMEGRVRRFLSDYLVDTSPSESKLLDVWMDEYNRQVDGSVQDG